jgi:hypothetical protein
VVLVTGSQIAFQSEFVQRRHSGGALLTEQGDLVGTIRADDEPLGLPTI